MSTDLAKTPPATLKSMLSHDKMKKQFAAALPKHLSPERFVRVAMTALTRIPRLAECEQTSFFRCLLDLSSMGLEPNGRDAHLIPFRNNKTNQTECQLIIDYKGLLALVRRSGEVESLHCDLVYEHDSFKRGIKDGKAFLEWEPGNGERGEVIGAFSVVMMKGAGAIEWDYMTRDEIEAVRARSKAGKSGPWVTDWNEMAKKTVFRRHSKRLPFSPEIIDKIEQDDRTLFDMRAGSIDVETEEVRKVPESSTLQVVRGKLSVLGIPETDFIEALQGVAYIEAPIESLESLSPQQLAEIDKNWQRFSQETQTWLADNPVKAA